MNVGDSFKTGVAYGERHLHVVAAIDDAGMVITFNVTTNPPRRDTSCPVDATDDPRITKPSWLVFAPCEPMVEHYLDKEVRDGLLEVTPISAAFLLKIQQAALRSAHTERKHKTLLRSKGITLPEETASSDTVVVRKK